MRFNLALLAALSVGFCSCQEDVDPNQKAVYPVTGKITVDGAAPGSPISIKVHEEGGMDTENPTMSSSISNPDGTFALNTYVAGDGVPKGSYTLTFVWGTFNMVSMSYGGKDQLNERYDTVEESPAKFTVDGSGPVDLGTIELTTK